MRILILSFYYPPDIGPGPLRAKSIAETLKNIKFKEKVEIDVFTTMPNRYRSTKTTALKLEQISNLSIHRFKIPAHKNGMIDQSFSFLRFAFSVLVSSRNQKWDIVIATSSRLMTASLAAYIAYKKKAKLYLDIRDLFVDTISQVLNNKISRLIVPPLKIIEKITFRSANKINIVSEGFLKYILNYLPISRITTFPNGIDSKYISDKRFYQNFNDPIRITYAGNIGDGQGLHKIVPKIAKSFGDKIFFKIIGDGSKKKFLIEEIKNNKIFNVEFHKPVSRDKLIKIYNHSDILFLHLNEFNAFKKVLPSKIFDYALTNKPILAGVSGYASDFLKKNLPGVEIFRPCDISAMKIAFEKILKGPNFYDRKNFRIKFNRQSIIQNFCKNVLSL